MAASYRTSSSLRLPRSSTLLILAIASNICNAYGFYNLLTGKWLPVICCLSAGLAGSFCWFMQRQKGESLVSINETLKPPVPKYALEPQ